MELCELIGSLQLSVADNLTKAVEVVKGVIANVRNTPELPPTRLDGRVCVVTGATSGIGRETARELARRGAKVILGCRDPARGQETAQLLEREGGRAVYMDLDLASFTSVRNFCAKINKDEVTVDFLINNAGVFTLEKLLTVDGLETQLQVNHLSHFLITGLLLDKLKAKGGARIINVSSIAHWMSIGVPKDVNWEMVKYNGFLAYANSKLANVLFSNELERRLNGSGVSVYSLHPGGVSTNLGRELENYLPESLQSALTTAFNWVAKTSEEGAKTTLYCCLESNLPPGYYDEMRLGWTSPLCTRPDLMKSLWQQSEVLTGLQY